MNGNYLNPQELNPLQVGVGSSLDLLLVDGPLREQSTPQAIHTSRTTELEPFVAEATQPGEEAGASPSGRVRARHQPAGGPDRPHVRQRLGLGRSEGLR